MTCAGGTLSNHQMAHLTKLYGESIVKISRRFSDSLACFAGTRPWPTWGSSLETLPKSMASSTFDSVRTSKKPSKEWCPKVYQTRFAAFNLAFSALHLSSCFPICS